MSPITHGEREAWLALASAHGVGEHTFGRLVEACGSASAVLEAVRAGTLVERLAGDGQRALGRSVRAAIEAAAAEPEAAGARLASHGLWSLTPLDAAYPSRFDVLPAAPPVLYGWGDAGVLARPRAVAIVGTRRPTPQARVLASRTARRCVDLDATVVSGLAFGVDGVAHAATVEAGGCTVAVIAAGHAQPGPRAHRTLLASIVGSGGAVISEQPPTVRPERGSFPRRNRLIAALADATVIVEAPAHSGAINTAHHALEQGRPVFVAPGRPGDASVAGSLRLLRETPARPLVGDVELMEDLLRAFDEAAPGDAIAMAGTTGASVLAGLGPVERRVATAVAGRAATLDDLVATTGLDPGVLAGAVSLLHLRGLVRMHGPTVLASGVLVDGA